MEEEKKFETEEEMKRRLKKELMAEILDEIKEEKGLTELEEIIEDDEEEEIVEEKPKLREEKKEEEVPEKKVKKEPLPPQDPKEAKASLILAVVCFAIIGIGIFFFSNIYDFIQDLTMRPPKEDPVISNKNPEPIYEEITLKSEVVGTFTYPIMRNSQYSADTYYKRDSITMSDFSNNDILYNAFIHVYIGNLEDYKGGYIETYCGTDATKKAFKARYIELRMDNLFSKNTKFTHGSFTVPSNNLITTDIGKTYAGKWNYDSINDRYIYYGNCAGTPSGGTEYYDLLSAYQATGKQKNTVIEVSYYIGFAKVNSATKEYSIYSDVAMTHLIDSGTLTTGNHMNELNNKFAQLPSNNLSKYKYTFSSNECSYKDYCFEKGEWLK